MAESDSHKNSMQCINPLPAYFDRLGNIVHSPKQADRSISGFQLECRKCLPCRINSGRELAIRAMHEAQMHKNNIFLTLTYNDENLKSPKLQYLDFQLFMKSLLEKRCRDITDPELKRKLSIPFMVTGEYGDKNQRPHWHAILFNYAPLDPKPERTTDLDHNVFTSEELSNLWGKGRIEYGSVTLESASYVARYAAKKLIHGPDDSHDYHPVHHRSKQHAIGKSWISKYWKFTFENGYVTLPNGQKAKIPRYYSDWLKKNQPTQWEDYVTKLRHENTIKALKKSRDEEIQYLTELMNRNNGSPRLIHPNKMKLTILNQKFKRLQEKLKL